jgi:hypothetical protein
VVCRTVLAALCTLDSRHSNLAVTESLPLTSDNRPRRKLPSLITDIGFYADDSKRGSHQVGVPEQDARRQFLHAVMQRKSSRVRRGPANRD